MFDDNFVKDCIAGCIEKGIDKFIIYPFGINGVNVKHILKEYFNLEPYAIADNKYSKYNSLIIDINSLKKNGIKMCILLSQ